MSAIGQCIGRVPLNVRSYKNSQDFARLGALLRATASYDSSIDITLNGTDVSNMGTQALRYPRPLNAIASLDLGQPTPANQPLYTGAPTYGGFQSVEFSAASPDKLFKANTNLIGLDPISFVIVRKLLTTKNVYVANSVGVTGGLWIRALTNNSLQNLGGGGRTFTDGASDSNLHVLAAGQDRSQTNALMLIDGTPVAVAAAGTMGADPGPTAQLSIGDHAAGGAATDMDFLAMHIFQYMLPVNLAAALCAAARARYQF